MSVVRADGIRGYRELAAELGGDVDALLADAHIAPEALDDPETFLPYLSVIRLLETTARALACPDFGLRLSQRQDIGILGPLAVAMQNSATLGEALVCASRYIFVHSPAIGYAARPSAHDGRVLVDFELLLARTPPAAQVTELSIGVGARVVQLLGEGRARVANVRFPHAPRSPLATYRAYFGTSVTFGAACAGYELREADLALPIRSGSRVLRELAEEYLELHYAAPHTAFAGVVRGVVWRSLGTGCCSCEDVAAALAVHPRTLQRRLRAEGTSFERIKDEARADLARRYLEQHELPLTQVAALLDYSEQSALTRSCRRWFGRPPRALRAQLLAGGSAPVGGPPAAGRERARHGASGRSRYSARTLRATVRRKYPIDTA